MGAVGWVIRYFFILRHRGVIRYELVFAACAGFLFVAYAATSVQRRDVADIKAGAPVLLAEAMQIIDRRCTACHSARPSNQNFSAPPAGVAFDAPDDIKRYAQRIYARAVLTGTMPLGNATGMTREERRTLGRWVLSLDDPQTEKRQ